MTLATQMEAQKSDEAKYKIRLNSFREKSQQDEKQIPFYCNHSCIFFKRL